ncbi:MAG TPA: hypothetical protein VN679_00865 [Candidatus Acidoferrales bacterium]|jgi:hypothetical protein|nr:hypothetical protein [Candidatus Acidoferrales bacterium]
MKRKIISGGEKFRREEMNCRAVFCTMRAAKNCQWCRKIFCACAAGKKISKKIFSAFPQRNACASMPSSQLNFFVAVAVLAALYRPYRAHKIGSQYVGPWPARNRKKI